jgi:biotin-(acetyl-CoA carboxylase) ligase
LAKNPTYFTTDVRLDLPPGYTVVGLRESGDAFAHAQSIASEEGAGTLVWVRRFDTVEFAVVLEPEQPLADARRVLYAVMNAAADAIAAFCPPERPLTFSWPDTISLDGGILGGVQLAWPDGCAEDRTPDWLVAGVMLRSVVAVKRDLADLLANRPAGLSQQLDHIQTRGTSLEAEGFEIMAAEPLINSFCRHFLVYLDQWNEKGFIPVGQTYLARMPEQRGVKRGIDGNGDLLVRTISAGIDPERQSLLEALAKPQWLDPATREPWL